MLSARIVCVFVTLAWSLGACAESAPTTGGEAPSTPPRDLIIEGAGGTVYAGHSVEIVFREGWSFAQVTAEGWSKDGAGWGMTCGVGLEDVRAGEFGARLERKPLALGNGIVSLSEGTTLSPVESGEVRFTLELGGAIEGAATTEPTWGSASLRGKYALRCLVEANESNNPSGGTPGPGTKVYVDDVEMSSQFCQQFVDLR